MNFKSFVISALLLLAFMYIALAPGVYATNDFVPPRALSYLTFVMNIFWGFWAIVLGYRFGKNISKYLITASFVTIILFGYYACFDFPVAKSYNHEIADLHHRLLELQKQGVSGTVKIKPFQGKTQKRDYILIWNGIMNFYDPSKKNTKKYYPYMRYTLSTDVNHWTNRGLKKYLKLDYDIEGWAETEK